MGAKRRNQSVSARPDQRHRWGADGLAVALDCVAVIGRHLADGGVALLQLGSSAQATVVGRELIGHSLVAGRLRGFGEHGVVLRIDRAGETPSGRGVSRRPAPYRSQGPSAPDPQPGRHQTERSVSAPGRGAFLQQRAHALHRLRRLEELQRKLRRPREAVVATQFRDPA